MKGKIKIEVEYDTTRIPTGDVRYDFVTDVVVEGLSEELSFRTVQEFKDSIAYEVNETIALTPDKNIPPEKWPVVDTIWGLYYIIEMGGHITNLSHYRDFRNGPYSRHNQIKVFYEQITKRFTPLALEYVSITDQKTEHISGILFNQLLDGALEQANYTGLNRVSRDEIKTGLRYLLDNQNHEKQYQLSIICTVLKEVYKVLDEELPYFLNFGGHRSLGRALEDDPFGEIDGIAGRLGVEPKLLEGQMNAYVLAKENEAS